MIALIIILCLIVICLFALFCNKDEVVKQVSSGYKERVEYPVLDLTPKTPTYLGDNPIIGICKNGDYYTKDGKIHMINTSVLDPNRTINLMPNVDLLEIGYTFDIEDKFPIELKNKIYRLFSNRIYTDSRNNKETLIYAQRCDVLPSGVVKIYNFKNNDVDSSVVIDPLGNKIQWMGAFKLINENGELITNKIIIHHNNQMICNEFDEIEFFVKNPNPTEKIYAIWCAEKSHE